MGIGFGGWGGGVSGVRWGVVEVVGSGPPYPLSSHGS